MPKLSPAVLLLAFAPIAAQAEFKPNLADRHLEAQYVAAARSQDWDSVEMIEMSLERRYRSRGANRPEIRARLQELERESKLDLSRSLDTDEDRAIDDDDGERRVRHARLQAVADQRKAEQKAYSRALRHERTRRRHEAYDTKAPPEDDDDDGVAGASTGREIEIEKVTRIKKVVVEETEEAVGAEAPTVEVRTVKKVKIRRGDGETTEEVVEVEEVAEEEDAGEAGEVDAAKDPDADDD